MRPPILPLPMCVFSIYFFKNTIVKVIEKKKKKICEKIYKNYQHFSLGPQELDKAALRSKIVLFNITFFAF